jgi:hypothetical protein
VPGAREPHPAVLEWRRSEMEVHAVVIDPERPVDPVPFILSLARIGWSKAMEGQWGTVWCLEAEAQYLAAEAAVATLREERDAARKSLAALANHILRELVEDLQESAESDDPWLLNALRPDIKALLAATQARVAPADGEVRA